MARSEEAHLLPVTGWQSGAPPPGRQERARPKVQRPGIREDFPPVVSAELDEGDNCTP
jgi:hypothetical protein